MARPAFARLLFIFVLGIAMTTTGVVLIVACSSSSTTSHPRAAMGRARAAAVAMPARGDASMRQLDASHGDACAKPTYGQPCAQGSDCSCGGLCAENRCVPPAACDEAVITWSGPTENTDGTCIENFAGFTLRWWKADGGTPDDNVHDAGFPWMSPALEPVIWIGMEHGLTLGELAFLSYE